MGSQSVNESFGCVIAFDIGQPGETLQLTDAVLNHFDRHRQTLILASRGRRAPFARLHLPVRGGRGTGPRRTDGRARYSDRPDHEAQRAEIESRFRRDLHFVGCWHTHPEDVASPSHVDVRNTADCVRRSHHSLTGFLLVVVGGAERFPIACLFRSAIARLCTKSFGPCRQPALRRAHDRPFDKATQRASVGRISRRRNPPFCATKSAGYASLTRPTRYSLTSSTHFASPSDFSALPLSSLSAFMNSAKPAESR